MTPYISFTHLRQGSVGIALQEDHHTIFLEEKQPVGWVEIRAENFLNFHTRAYQRLEKIRQDYPVSIHGVNLSIGSSDGIDEHHVQCVKQLIDRIEPFLISDHLSWARHEGYYFNNALPLPYTQEALGVCTANLDHIQNIFQRPLLVQNPSTYLQYQESLIGEADFLTTLVNRTGAGILLDLNSLYVSCWNHGWTVETYLQNLPERKIQEIKLSGHSLQEAVRINDRSSCVSPEVWELYQATIDLFSQVPTVIEWENNIPELAILLTQAAKAQGILDRAASAKPTGDKTHVRFG